MSEPAAIPHVGRRNHGLRAAKAVEFGYGTVVLQSGEDPGLNLRERIERLIEAELRQKRSLAVTLSLGERDEEELAAWRRAGADRYLLRFETSNQTLYERIHPPRGRRTERIPHTPCAEDGTRSVPNTIVEDGTRRVPAAIRLAIRCHASPVGL